MSKYQRILLAVENGVKFILVAPSSINNDKYPLYWIEYFANGKQVKYKDGVKQLYLSWDGKTDLKHVFESKLAKLKDGVSKLASGERYKITMFSGVMEIAGLFMKYHKQRHQLEEIQDIYNYTERHKKLSGFLAAQYKDLVLQDLTANVWVDYRTYLKQLGLGNSTINLQMVYVSQLYIWLSDIHELPIPNHAKKLKKLDISKQQPKFNEIDSKLFDEFFEVVARDDRYLRLNLMTRLVAENTLRPIQVRELQVADVNLDTNQIKIYDGKGKRDRIIIISDETKDIIQKILDNTLKTNRIPDKEDYIIGFSNQTKPNKPFTQSMFRERIVMPFKEEFPQFESILLYDFKHTSITRAFQVHSLYEIQKRAGHAKVTTTSIYDRSQLISRPITVKELSEIG
ncbi:Site-specific recombinase XerD [Pedobacter sp. ok626]|uniref:tyrosine-type recombinase/integrase n=1 Tax=Pedobacter sp. ok626 TaxID=1761882 RepID=UPI00088FDA2D|nr:site-specific integrase [Pedobacter sp. ok626]SDJ94684.1 Site-specific recombinase XerD [Pedobacter sp. ok626]